MTALVSQAKGLCGRPRWWQRALAVGPGTPGPLFSGPRLSRVLGPGRGESLGQAASALQGARPPLQVGGLGE